MNLNIQNYGQIDNFDTIFDDLLAIADDEEALAKKRKEIIEQFILDLPEHQQDRARSIQWRLDIELDKCKNSTARFNKMVELFWKQFNSLNCILNGKTEQIKENAAIISFNKSKD